MTMAPVAPRRTPSLFCSFVFFFGHTRVTWKLLGQKSELIPQQQPKSVTAVKMPNPEPVVPQENSKLLALFIVFFSFSVAPVANGNSQARDGIGTRAVTYTTCASMFHP